MATFSELVELMRNPADGFISDSNYVDSLINAHDADVMGAAGDASVWTEEKLSLEAALKERDATISDLKSRNYDLLSRLPSSNEGADSAESESDNDDSDVDIDDLFS